MKKLFTTMIALSVGISSVRGMYSPSTQETQQVEAAGTVLLQIIETKHDANYELLLGLLKGFESRVAGDEKKVWILDTLIQLTMDKMGMMMNDEIHTGSRVFDISGTNYSFSQEEITVNKGDTITINFESSNGYHDRVLDEFGAATAAVKPGEGITSVTFVADKVGDFEYYCSIGNHRTQGMVGALIVKDTMMDDEVMDENIANDFEKTDAIANSHLIKNLITLENVVGTATIRGIVFDGTEKGSAANITEIDHNRIYAEFFDLPDVGSDSFYEGWIIRMKGGLSILSTGELVMEDEGKYVNDWISDANIDDHTFYVLTLEPRDNDPAPADHILEAHVR